MAGIVSELILKTGLFSAGIKSAQNGLKGLEKSVGSAKGIITGAFALITSSAAAVGLKHAFEVGSQLNILSAATGTAVRDLVILQKAFSENGIEADKVGQMVGRMRKQIVAAAGGGGGDTFAKLKVNVRELGKMNASEQMQTLGAAIMRLQNPTERSAAAMAIFGRNGQQMLSLFANSGALEEAAQAVGAKAKILDENSALFHDITVKLSIVGGKLQGMFFGMAAKVGPAIQPIIDALTEISFADLGKQIGDALAFLITAFSTGEIGTIIGRSVQIALVNAFNFVKSVAYGVAYAFGQLLTEAVANAVTLFQIVTTPGFWTGIKFALEAAAIGFTALLLDGVAMLLDQLKNVPLIGEKIGKGADTVRATAASMHEAASATGGAAGDYLAAPMAMARKRMDEALGNVGAAYQKGSAAAPQTDTSDMQESLDKSVANVAEMVKLNQQAADDYNKKHRPVEGGGTIPDMEEEPKRKFGAAFVQSLYKIGGGGTSVGGGDPLLNETRRQTSLLSQIAKNTGLKTGGLKTGTLATASFA